MERVEPLMLALETAMLSRAIRSPDDSPAMVAEKPAGSSKVSNPSPAKVTVPAVTELKNSSLETLPIKNDPVPVTAPIIETEEFASTLIAPVLLTVRLVLEDRVL